MHAYLHTDKPVGIIIEFLKFTLKDDYLSWAIAEESMYVVKLLLKVIIILKESA